jgi:hypothetical protein
MAMGWSLLKIKIAVINGKAEAKYDKFRTSRDEG